MRKKNNKLLLFAVVAGILLILAGQLLFRQKKNIEPVQEQGNRDITNEVSDLKTKEENITGEKVELSVTIKPTVATSANLIIDFGNGQIITGEGTSNTVFGNLEEVAKKNSLKIEVKKYQYGNMVVKIGDLANSGNSYWSYTVNGKPGMIAAEKYVVYPGFKIEWKYIK